MEEIPKKKTPNEFSQRQSSEDTGNDVDSQQKKRSKRTIIDSDDES